MKRQLWKIIFSACLVLFTGYVLLDTFVISHTYIQDVSEINTETFNAIKIDETVITENKEMGNDDIDAQPGDADVNTVENDGEEPEDDDNTGRRYGRNREKNSGYRKNNSARDEENSSLNKDEDRSQDEEGIRRMDDAAGADDSYEDENIAISLSTWVVNGTDVYVADVQISSVEYLKTAFAQDSFGKNIEQVASQIAKEHNAILAINGDNYGTQENGFVIRNGIVYREKGNRTKILCIYNDGLMTIENPKEITARELADQGVWQAFSFGPALIDEGEILVKSYSEVKFASSSNPRTAIGMIDKLHYLFVVADGRTDESSGLSLLELAQFMQDLGAVVAYNLDGGGSSTMVLNGDVVNNPTSYGNNIQEREVTDIVYIG